MFDALTDRLFCRNIRSRRSFEETADELGRRLYPEGQQLMAVVVPVLRAWGEAQKSVSRMEAANPANAALLQICADVKQQMARLVPDNFMAIYDAGRLEQLPRYLNARAIRVRRAAVDCEKDRLKAVQLEKFTEALERLLGSLSAETSGAKRAALEEYFWMVEEFSVSLFAQELGTVVPVSKKRLESKLADIQRMI